LCIDDGKIQDQGTHAELVQREGYGKRFLLGPFFGILQVIVLPRQARDKDEETQFKKKAFCFVVLQGLQGAYGTPRYYYMISAYC